EVCEVSVGHGIAAEQVGGGGCSARPEFLRFVPLEIVDLVAVAIDEDAPGGAHDGRTAVAAIVLHSLAALPFPGNHLVVVLKAGHQRIVKLPVIFKMVSAA